MTLKYKQTFIVLVLILLGTVFYARLQLKKQKSHLNEFTVQKQIPQQNHQQTAFNDLNQFEKNIAQKQSIETILTSEEQNLYHFNYSTSDHTARLRKITDRFNNTELLQLKNHVLNSQISSDQRFIALHFLILQSPRTHDLLTDIFYTDHELLNKSVAGHTADEAQKEIELNLRMLAIEQIEKNIFQTRQSPNPLKLDLRYNEIKNSYLKSLLSIVQTSEKLNTPLLSQFINSTLKGVN